MSENKLQVELTGDNASLIAALEQAQQKIDKLTNKGKEDVDALGEAFENLSLKSIAGAVVGFATLAGAAEKAVELIAEGIKSIIEIIPKAIEGTEKLVETFEQLHITAGMSLDDFNQWNATIKLAGGTADDYNSIIKGMQMGITKNSELLIRNGIAADEAGLAQMSMGEYISKVVEKMEKLTDATEKDQLLKQAFGRSGIQFASVLEKINEEQERGNRLSLYAEGLNETAVTDAKRLREAKGDLAYQEEVVQRRIANSTSGMSAYIIEQKAAILAHSNLISLTHQMVETGEVIAIQEEKELEGIRVMVTDWEATAEAAKTVLETRRKLQQEQAEEAKEKKRKEEAEKLVTKEQLDREKEAAKEREKLAKEAADTLVALHETTKRLQDEDLKTAENVTVEQKRQLGLKEAYSKLENAQYQIGKTLEKGSTPENIKAAEEAKLAALQLYIDQTQKVERDAAAENQKIKEDEDKKILAEDNKVKDLLLSNSLKNTNAIAEKAIDNINFQKTLNNISGEQAIQQIIAINNRKYDEEVKAVEARIALRKLETVQDKAAIEKLYNELDALKRKHDSDARKENEVAYLEARKHNSMAGVVDGAKEYVRQAKDHYTNYKNMVTQTLNAAETAVQSSLKGMITGQMSFGEAMKGIWSGIATAVLDAVTKMIAQWVVAQAAQLMFTAETEAASNVEASAALDVATAESFAAYAWIPFVGYGLGLAQSELILASYVASSAANKAATAFATGGMVEKPTYGLLGEAGQPELIAPKSDFMQVTKELVASGASMYKAIVETTAKTSKGSVTNYAPSTNQTTNKSTQNSGPVFNISGVIGDKKQLGDYLKNTLNQHTRIYGSA